MALAHNEIEEIASWVKSPTLGKVVTMIEAKYQAAWKLAKTTDDREFCWRMIQCLHALVSELQGITDAASIERHNQARPKFNINNVASKAEPRTDL